MLDNDNNRSGNYGFVSKNLNVMNDFTWKYYPLIAVVRSS